MMLEERKVGRGEVGKLGNVGRECRWDKDVRGDFGREGRLGEREDG